MLIGIVVRGSCNNHNTTFFWWSYLVLLIYDGGYILIYYHQDMQPALKMNRHPSVASAESHNYRTSLKARENRARYIHTYTYTYPAESITSKQIRIKEEDTDDYFMQRDKKETIFPSPEDARNMKNKCRRIYLLIHPSVHPIMSISYTRKQVGRIYSTPLPNCHPPLPHRSPRRAGRPCVLRSVPVTWMAPLRCPLPCPRLTLSCWYPSQGRMLRRWRGG